MQVILRVELSFKTFNVQYIKIIVSLARSFFLLGFFFFFRSVCKRRNIIPWNFSVVYYKCRVHDLLLLKVTWLEYFTFKRNNWAFFVLFGTWRAHAPPRYYSCVPISYHYKTFIDCFHYIKNPSLFLNICKYVLTPNEEINDLLN